MRSQISAERLSDFIGRVYDCVIAPEKWGAVVDAIRLEFSFSTAFLFVTALPEGQVAAIHASAGVDATALARIAEPEYGAEEAIELWGGPARIAHFPVGEPIIQSQATDRPRAGTTCELAAFATVAPEANLGVGSSNLSGRAKLIMRAQHTKQRPANQAASSRLGRLRDTIDEDLDAIRTHIGAAQIAGEINELGNILLRSGRHWRTAFEAAVEIATTLKAEGE